LNLLSLLGTCWSKSVVYLRWRRVL
jgi:hypothetical protein